jgi:predicted ribonuclease YlaK
MNNTYNFYDTCSLLIKANTLFEEEENVVISSVTLQELEEIKTNRNKTPDIKFAARKLLHTFELNPKRYEVVIFREDMLAPFHEKALEVNNDIRILSCAYWYDNNVHPDCVKFITNDLALKHIASLFFGSDSIGSIDKDIDDEYCGFVDISMTDEEMAEFYSHLDTNSLDLYINQYLILRNSNNEIVDKLKWNGEKYTTISYGNIDSYYFGKIKPYQNDPYQALAIDSFLNNKITLVKGFPGSGKSYLSLGYLFYLLGTHKIDKIIIMCNTVAAKGAARLGFYPGTRDEKLLDSQIGNFLASKLGDRSVVEQLMQQEKLILLPMSDIRGYDTTGMKAGIYITEAQNLDVSLMKLALQRIGEDSICIIDGDQKTQVDDVSFEGSNNGMRRLSKAFKGHDIYGEVELRKIHRSRIAELAELM